MIIEHDYYLSYSVVSKQQSILRYLFHQIFPKRRRIIILQVQSNARRRVLEASSSSLSCSMSPMNELCLTYLEFLFGNADHDVNRVSFLSCRVT